MSINPYLNEKNWAVVGASENELNFGCKVYKKLKAFDYNVYPVSPNYETVDGDKAYKSIKDIEGPVDVVAFVVNPRIGINILDECREKGYTKVWLQPGTASKALLEKAASLGIDVVESCVLVELR